jgi:hypothetical protein
MIAPIRSAARPSQSGSARAVFRRPSITRPASRTMVSASLPTRMLVPWSIVIGRSVFGRTVRHGTSRNVVSS